MCVYALIVLAVNYVADSAVFQVIRENIKGEFHDIDDSEGLEVDSAFVDIYGDFEH